MALKFWMGPSGSGKTRFLFEHVINEALNNQDKNYIVIVPEQFTLSTQRELIRLNKDHGILNIDVLSFQRLAYKIFEEVGFKNARGVSIDDMGKNLILRHLAEKCADELTVFSGKMDRLGYITEVKSAISEFMQYGVDTDKLHELFITAENAGRGQLSSKLHDVEILYREFNKYTEDKYITKEEILSKASRVVHKSERLKKSVVVFDGFTGFTPVQYDLIESLLQITHDIHVTILTDTRDEADKITYNTEHELFYLGYKTHQKLTKIAELNNIPVDKPFKIIEEVPRRFLVRPESGERTEMTDEWLVHLERNLFRTYSKPFPGPDKITGDNENRAKLPTEAVNGGIRVFTALQPIDEVRKVAVEIQKLIRNGCSTNGTELNNSIDLNNGKTDKGSRGIRFKNIAVVTGDIETYAPVIRRVFDEYDIPFFMDQTQPVLLNPFIEYIRALCDIITDNFSYNSVFRYMRSPLSGFNRNDIDCLENFVLKYGVKGVNTWRADWTEKYACYFKNMPSDDGECVNETLLMLNGMREKLVNDLSDAISLITGDNEKGRKLPTKLVNEINAVFMRTLEALDVENRLKMLADEYSITDDTFEIHHKKEYEKIYGLVMELMKRMEELLPDELIDVAEYGELLDAGFDEIRIGAIPLITDYIQIGDLTRSRFENIHTLFIVGAIDGAIPKNNNGGGIISDMEKEFIISSTPDIELSPTVREKAYTGQLYLYMLMTKPNKQLVLSYPRLNSANESVKPSYIVKVITDMFPDAKVENDFGNYFDKVYNMQSGLNVVSEHIKDEKSEGLIHILRENPSIRKIAEAAFMSSALSGTDAISKAVAEVLYGKAIIGSVTRLEQFAKCSFSYFLKYGLNLKERELFDFEAKDMGSVFHSVLEKYTAYVIKEGLSFTDIDDETMEALVLRAVDECISTPEYAVLSSTSRRKYMKERITRISLRSASVLTKQLSAGVFIPKDAEITFKSANNLDAFTFKLSDDEIMRLTGKIDRLDTYEDAENNRVYIKIIDYKSGDKRLDLVEVYRGLSLQLVMYMNAAEELMRSRPEYINKEIVPAGILYYHIDDPIVEAQRTETDDEIAKKIMKELKMRGLVNSDPEIIRLMDTHVTGYSDIIPVQMTQSGMPGGYSTVAATEDFEILSKFVNKKVREIGRDILSGNIKAEPHTVKGVDGAGCTYCEYKDICTYDDRIEDEADDLDDADNDGTKSKISAGEILDIMRRELAEAGELGETGYVEDTGVSDINKEGGMF